MRIPGWFGRRPQSSVKEIAVFPPGVKIDAYLFLLQFERLSPF